MYIKYALAFIIAIASHGSIAHAGMLLPENSGISGLLDVQGARWKVQDKPVPRDDSGVLRFLSLYAMPEFRIGDFQESIPRKRFGKHAIGRLETGLILYDERISYLSSRLSGSIELAYGFSYHGDNDFIYRDEITISSFAISYGDTFLQTVEAVLRGFIEKPGNLPISFSLGVGGGGFYLVQEVKTECDIPNYLKKSFMRGLYAEVMGGIYISFGDVILFNAGACFDFFDIPPKGKDDWSRVSFYVSFTFLLYNWSK